MNDLSFIGQVIQNLETAKKNIDGIWLGYYEVLELLGHIQSLEESLYLERENNNKSQILSENK